MIEKKIEKIRLLMPSSASLFELLNLYTCLEFLFFVENIFLIFHFCCIISSIVFFKKRQKKRHTREEFMNLKFVEQWLAVHRQNHRTAQSKAKMKKKEQNVACDFQSIFVPFSSGHIYFALKILSYFFYSNQKSPYFYTMKKTKCYFFRVKKIFIYCWENKNKCNFIKERLYRHKYKMFLQLFGIEIFSCYVVFRAVCSC